MFSRLCVAILLAGYVTCQTKYCCTPPQWEASFDTLNGGLSNGKPFFTQVFQNVSVDGNAHKVVSLMNSTSDGVSTILKIIQDYDAGNQYTIITGNCQISPLEAWSPKCVPDNAQLLDKTYFGTGDKKVDFDVYLFKDNTTTYYLDIASADCTPLYITGSGSTGNVSSFTVGTYSNLTLGIKDPTIFNIPDSCKKASRTNFATRRLSPVF